MKKKSVEHGADFSRVDARLPSEGADARGGAGGRNRILQRVYARRVDEQSCTLRFQIQRVGITSAARRDEVLNQSQRRLRLQCIDRHLMQKAAVHRRSREEPVAQPFGQRRDTPQRPEIEKNRRVEQSFRRRIANPVGKHRLPFIDAQTPARIAGHDAALAQREAARGERTIHFICEWQQALAQGGRRLSGGNVEDDAVVLIGAEGLLEPPFAAERDPAECHVIQRMARQCQLDHAAGHAVVQFGDELRKRLGAYALGQQVAREQTDAGRRALHVGDTHGCRDVCADPAQAQALERE